MNAKTMDQKKAELLHDPAFRQAYEDREASFAVALAAIQARKNAGMTQAEIAQRMHTTQSAVARLESGRSVPTLPTLEKYARATGTKLRVSFEPAY